MTNPHGAVVVLHQGHDQGVCPHFRKFESQLDLQWKPDAIRQDHAMSTGTLSNDLKSNGVPHFVSQEPDQLYVDEFHGATPIDDPKVVDMLSFFMNTDVSRFPRSSIEEMVAEVQVHSKRRESGRFEFDHPQGFLVVPNEQSTTDFCQIGGFQRIE